MTIVGIAAGAALIGVLIIAGYLLGGRHVRQYPPRSLPWRRAAALAGLVTAGAAAVVMVLAATLPHAGTQSLLGAIPVATFFLGAGAGRADGRKDGEVRGYDQAFLDTVAHGRPGVEH